MVTSARQWPGGPIIGMFDGAATAPTITIIARFALRVGNGDALPILLDAGVQRIDDAYQAALRGGSLRTDPPCRPARPSPTR